MIEDYKVPISLTLGIPTNIIWPWLPYDKCCKWRMVMEALIYVQGVDSNVQGGMQILQVRISI